jgi:hypothetical protein
MNEWRNCAGAARLLGLIVGLPLLAGLLGLRGTIGRHRTIREQGERIEWLRTAAAGRPVPPNDTLAPAAPRAGIGSGSFLRLVGAGHPGVTTERYTPYRIRQQGAAELHAGELVLSGGFIPMTRLLAKIEATWPEMIVSVGYRTEEQPPGRQKKLVMTLILQEFTDHEE